MKVMPLVVRTLFLIAIMFIAAGTVSAQSENDELPEDEIHADDFSGEDGFLAILEEIEELTGEFTDDQPEQLQCAVECFADAPESE